MGGRCFVAESTFRLFLVFPTSVLLSALVSNPSGGRAAGRLGVESESRVIGGICSGKMTFRYPPKGLLGSNGPEWNPTAIPVFSFSHFWPAHSTSQEHQNPGDQMLVSKFVQIPLSLHGLSSHVTGKTSQLSLNLF